MVLFVVVVSGQLERAQIHPAESRRFCSASTQRIVLSQRAIHERLKVLNLIKRLTLWISSRQRLEVCILQIQEEHMEGHDLGIKYRTIVVVMCQSDCRRKEQYQAMYQSFIRKNSIDSILDNGAKNDGSFERCLALQVPQVTISTLQELLFFVFSSFRE